ncbi:hypothetical protein BN1723_019615, partial [Verticillium longisporum]
LLLEHHGHDAQDCQAVRRGPRARHAQGGARDALHVRGARAPRPRRGRL